MVGTSNVNHVQETTAAFIQANHFKEHEADELLDSLFKLSSEVPESAIMAKKADSAETESDTYITDALNQAKKKIEERYNARLQEVMISERFSWIFAATSGRFMV